MMRALVPTALALLCTAPALARTVVAPHLPAVHPVPVAAPYDSDADARAQVASALAEARRTDRLVLLDFGGNWCPDCRVLAGVLRMPEVSPWVARNFVVAAIDVGRFNRNLDIAQAHGVKITAVPTVLVLTPDGRLLDPDGARALGDARTMTPQATVDLIARWASR